MLSMVHFYKTLSQTRLRQLVPPGFLMALLLLFSGSHVQAQSANFTSSDPDGCSPMLVQFINLSTTPGNPANLTYAWDFGNGNTSVFPDPIATYITPGTYTVRLTITDITTGASSTITRTNYVTVFANPVSNFTSNIQSGCAPLPVSFSDNSTNGSAPIVSWSWDFGDGTLASGQNVSHTYTTSGNYNVTLVTVDANGCQDTEVKSAYIRVSSVASVSFTATPTTACNPPLDVTFTPNINPAGTYTYLWDFGDGNTSALSNPTHTYAAPGNYTVNLTVTDPLGCQESVQRVNYVRIARPTAAFSALNTTSCTGRTITFVNGSTGATSYFWNFGDGNTSTAANPTHFYAAPGTYSVTLTATNANGCQDFIALPNYITISQTPDVNFSSPNRFGCQVPLTVDFLGTSSSPIASWNWNFGDGNSSNTQIADNTYLTPGLYTVSLTVTSTNGCQATETKAAFVRIVEPDAAFATSRTEGCIPLTVNFVNLSTANEPIASYLWEFGDGNISTLASPTHVYTAPGQYTVRLTIRTVSGCTNTEVLQYIEAGNRPVANFTGTPRLVCVGENVFFSDLSTGNVTDWQWNFGDGNGAGVPNPVHVYQDTGLFAVTLIVEENGCADTIAIPNFVQVRGAVADFTMSTDQGCNPPVAISFFDQSLAADTWLWNFGDGNTSTLRNPVHTYTTTGVFTVTLTVRDTVLGCVDQIQDQVTIRRPLASFTASQTLGCVGSTIAFNNFSIDANTWLWEFGDGGTSTAANPSYTYSTPGTYTVRLTASDGVCSNTFTLPTQIVIGGPEPDFSVSTATGCAPLSVAFTDLTVPNGGTSITSWLWNFGDGNTSTLQNPVHVYTTPGVYSVTLRVLDNQGCLNTLTRNSIINPTFPNSDFTADALIACPGSLVRFTSTATGTGISYLWDFGDGTSSIFPNPTKLYPGPGIYTVRLTVTDINGCQDTEIKTSYINISEPTANFTANVTSATCPPLSVSFTNLSSPNVVSWYWDFGDGTTSNLPNPAKIYTFPGDFTVTLVVTSAQGCTDTMRLVDFIQIDGPTGSFTMSPNVGCMPLLVNFSVNSPDPSYTYQWDFGDGSGGFGVNTAHLYLTDTVARPILIIEDAAGCRVGVRSPDSINIRPLPLPSFNVSRTEICLGESVSFQNTSSSERPITGVLWTFGDGSTSTGLNPSYTYADTGTFYVNLRLTTLDGCTDTLDNPVAIRVTAPPTAVFTPTPAASCEPATISFTQSSSGYFPIVSYAWDFGDGNTATGPIIGPHTYVNAGIYTATLTVTDTRGCTGNQSRNVEAYPLPNTNFFAPRYGCAPIAIPFTDITAGSAPAVAWLWDFGDGNTSTLRNPTHTYAANGIYTVRLRVVDSRGCVREEVKPNYIVLREPVANFTSNAVIACPPLTVNFTNTSTIDTTSTYQWLFGDGATSTAQNPSHVYHGEGNFTVTLIVTNIFGCTDTVVMPNHVRTYTRPSANLALNDADGCLPFSVTGTSTSTPGSAALTNYLWSFGNGVTLTGTPVTYQYNVAGTYNLSLVVTDANGCRDTAARQVRVFGLPRANYRASDSVGCAIANVTFNNLSSGPAAIATYNWTFGDGFTGIGAAPTHSYLNNGNYTVKLVITDINGCKDSLTKVNYIRLAKPTANFTANVTSICPGQQVRFTDLSTGPYGINGWNWSFGDGTTSTTRNPTKVYTTPGLYTVRLIARDAEGCRDTLTRVAYIRVNTPPTAQFTTNPTFGCTPLQVTFGNTSVNGSTPVVQWAWNFGDGGSAAVPNPTYLYNASGTYTVVLTTTDAAGCTDTAQARIYPFQGPRADFVANTRVGCAPQAITFSDISTSPFVKTGWFWDFGDGNTSTLQSPTHTYTSNGIYTVKLVITDQNGCKDSLTRVNYIRLRQPVADFTMDNSVVCPNTAIGVRFSDATVADTTLTSWLWEFGDGNASTAQNPSYSYSAPGTYTVRLIVTNVLNCRDTVVKTNVVSVLNPPVAAFVADTLVDCAPLSLQLTDQSVAGSAPVVAWRWDFGNGDTSIVRNPGYVYTTPGVYRITLRSRDANGCVDTASVSVRARALPVANFISPDTLGCAPDAVSFISTSTGPAVINYWKWYFGDGDSAVMVANPVHTYQNDGVYTVRLIIRDVNGCMDTLVRPNYIRLTHPSAAFTYNTSVVCPGIPVGVTFTDATVADHPISSWAWSFGDGGTSTLQNPSYSYNTPGTYTVRLIVTNVLGCRDTATVVAAINVLNPPVAGFSIADPNNCVPFTCVFSNTSTSGSAPIVNWEWDFGNGATSLVPNPSYTYTTPGIYTVTLRVTDNNGCVDTARRTVQAFSLPVASFMATDTLGCPPASITFLGSSTSAAPITGRWWTFGDGGSSTSANPTHVYTANGVYSVKLLVEDANGCRDSVTRPNYIRITRPVANFSANVTAGCPALTVQFTDNSIPDHPITSWLWDFGDGDVSALQNPSHTYTDPGVYTVRLTITNSIGCVTSFTRTNYIRVHTPPTAVISPASPEGCGPLTVDFIDASTAGSAGIVGWNWNFGNGQTSTVFNPAPVTYTTAGIYTVTLTVRDANGCTATTTTPVEVYAQPVAAFVANQTVGCAPANITFTDQSTGTSPAVAWEWNFGDGGTSIQRNPTHTYTANGVYTVRLIVTDANGCKDTLVRVNYIRLREPVTNFTQNLTQGCSGLTVNFSDLSTSDTTLVGWVWDFGDGTTSASRNPVKTYSTPGSYTVTLTVRDILGCQHTVTRPGLINIFQGPNAQFSVNDSVGCAPFTVAFSNLSTGTNSPIVNRLWNFGNGFASSVNNPVHTFLTPGNYTVTLTVTDANGCVSQRTRVIRVLQNPTANFFANITSTCPPATVSFSNTSTGPALLNGFVWDFGDGATSTLPSPSHTYSALGDYTVRLIVVDQFGCRDTLTRVQYIHVRGPEAAFSMNRTTGCPGVNIRFTDRSTADTTLTNWSWDFGDGSSSTVQNPQHTYANPGQYTVRLLVRDANGCTDAVEYIDTIRVFNGPDARFGVSSVRGCAPFTPVFNNTSTAGDAPIATYLWDLGNGVASAQVNPVQTFTSPGDYTIGLTVIDQNGCSDYFEMDIEVVAPPTPNFTVSRRFGCAPTPITFTSTSTSSSPIVSYLWNFGDGNTATVANPTHTYMNNGVYTVRLTVTDLNGCTSTIVRPAHIILRSPQAQFIANRTNVCPGDAIQFTDLSVADTTLISWQWDFGDGSVSTQRNPAKVYMNPGTYTVRLVITNVLGCVDEEVKIAYVNVNTRPDAQFVPNTPAGCTPFTVSLNNTTVANSNLISGYEWTFGNGLSSTLPNPSVTYTTAGIYTITLVAIDQNGCRDTATRTLQSFNLPTARFRASDSTGCAPKTVTFIDQSTRGSGNIISYVWNFGDGNSSTAQFPTHTYLNDGIYTVTLTVTDQNGCSHTLTKPNYIRLTRPAANFSGTPTQVCPGETVQFTDLSVADTTLTNWLWSFGDGATSTLRNPSHVYTAAGQYTVTLRVRNVFGCEDEEVKTNYVRVLPGPAASFAVADTGGCTPFQAFFTDTSVPNGFPLISWFWEFGDGTTSTLRNPTKTYTTAGIYTVRLTVTDSRGCTGTTVRNVTSYVNPIANFRASDTTGCAQFISFADLSISPYEIVAWEWDFGDGNTSTLENPSNTYLNTGTYNVTLRVTDEYGCQSTITRANYIRVTRPIAAFLQDQDVICPGTTVSFFETSIPDFPIVLYEWDFGDGGTATGTNPSHAFMQPGLYTVTLTVTNTQGCRATSTATVEVLTNPVARFGANPDEACRPAQVVFTDQSQGTNSNLIYWAWSFGDGGSSLSQNPTYTYQTAGTYQASLLVIDANGCTDDTVVTIQVNPLPQVNFRADNPLGCAPKSVQFTDLTQSQHAIAGWFWEFGDGTTSTQRNPVKFYANDGLYTVRLTVTDINGCVSSHVKNQYIRLRHPVVNFGNNPSVGCPPLTVSFSDQTLVDTTLVSWRWDYGDGGTSTNRQGAHIYTTPGTYTVTLIVTNVLGCSDTLVRPNLIRVYAPPVARFTSPDTVGCAPFTTSFFNASSFTEAPIIAWSWDFGDGNTSNLINPSHTWQDPGVYYVQLTVTDANGCSDRRRMMVTVHDLPQPSFSANDRTGCAPHSVTFTDQSFSLYPIANWNWNFGDGNSSTQQFPTHTYLANGTYTVSLTVTDVNGCVNTRTAPQYIRLSNPVANFSLSDSATCLDNTVTFSDLSTSDTTLVGWLWNFGDGTTSTQRNPGHVYTSAGTYSVTLTVTNADGCTGTITRPNVVRIWPGPSPSFTPSVTQGCAPLTVNFLNTTTINGAPIVGWQWDFADGGSSIFTNPQYTFTTPGVYPVTLLATDAFGCTRPFTVNITVHRVPDALFTSNQRFGCAPASIQFLDQSIQGSSPLASWVWNFGDGNTSTQQFPTHTYANDGNYTVSLSVVDVNGCADQIIWPNYIQLSHPVADFTVSDTVICPNTLVSFFDQSVPDTTLIGWLWNFGDGSTSTLRNPTHTYTTAGLYNVTLTITNLLGCSDVEVKSNLVRVLDGPTAQFTPSFPYGCTPFDVQFTDASVPTSAPIVSWQWSFGDGNTSTARNPGHTYVNPGVYTVRLTVTDNRGCPHTFTRTVEALRRPTANFLSTDTLGCAVHTAAFSDLTLGVNPITAWEWSFGDGNTSNVQNPVHNYQNDGLFTVSLIAIDYYGCRDTMTRNNYVRLTSPTPRINVLNATGCPGIQVQFRDSTIADTTLVSWYWTFGDGTFSVARNPIKTYNVPGNYTVTMRVRNINGCERTITVPNAVRVSQPPVADFVPTDTAGCEPFTVTLTDATQAFTSPVVAWFWDFGTGDSSRIQDPTYTFVNPGTYNVKLRIVDANGCPAETTKVLRSWVRPTADFMTPDTTGCSPFDAQFTDLSTGPFPLAGWNWTFGDGGTSTQQFPLYSYQKDGNYSVQLIVRDIHECRDTLLKPLYIRLSHPEAQFEAATRNGCEGTVVSFNNTTIADTTIVGWFWDFGDGTQSNLRNPVKTYNQSGSYDVMLVATNILGCRDTMVMRNFVRIFEPPTVAFTSTDTSRCEAFQAIFTDWSTSPFGVAAWQWTVDDSIAKGTAQTMTHFFPAVGAYRVELKVWDANGCTDSLTKMVYVRPVPVANFTASDTLGCAPATINFRDRTIHTPAQWFWDFGDGGTSTDQHPSYTYQQDGVYTVRLRVVDQYGCEDEFTRLNYIRLDHPNGDFVVDYNPGCPPIRATFNATATSQVGIAGYIWDFGNGRTGLGQQTVHTYNEPGLFTVTLIVLDSLGCRDTVVMPDAVNALLDRQPDPISLYNVTVLDDRRVEVRFARTTITDFREYTIYREQPGVGFVPVYTTQYINDTLYIDNNLDTRANSYCYKVTATNFCGTEGDINSSFQHCTIELSTAPIPGQIILDWTPYVGFDVEVYEIYSVKNYSLINPTLIATVPGFTTRFNDVLENCFTDHSYRIKAIGRNLLEESWSDTSRTFNANRVVGDPVHALRATVENNKQVLVEWEPVEMAGVQFIYIDKRSERSPNWTTIATLLPGEVKLIDSANVDVSEEWYAYRMHAEDTCGNTTPLEGRYAKTINLRATRTDSSSIRLEFNRYEEWLRDVLRYRVELWNEAIGEWVLVRTINSTTDTLLFDKTPYVDITLPWEQTSYCYRVWADEKGGNLQTSLSNEDCITIPPGIFAPNAFTPNGDGINDRFYLQGVYAQTFNLKVFSRWGLMLYESDDIDEGWDGNYQGGPVAEGVYVFVATGTGFNGQKFTVKGTITLIR